jgi:hypothetical protein|tara:strand:+ start:619 stop:780 length:162 start_codon:yes stop_codon:yes gene_type:complete
MPIRHGNPPLTKDLLDHEKLMANQLLPKQQQLSMEQLLAIQNLQQIQVQHKNP